MTDLLRRILATADMAYHARGQGRYPFKPLPQILADQGRRLHRMVIHAYRTVPYYRETMQRLGLRPSDLHTVEDLSRLPLLLREHVHRDPEYYVSTAQPLSRYVRLDSSGTTAWLCPFHHDTRSIRLNRAYGARARAVYAPLLGRQWGYRQTRIVGVAGTVARVERFVEEQTWLPPGIRLARQSLELSDSPEQMVRDINCFRPDVIWSLGSSLDQLFRHLLATGQEFRRPRVIVFGGDELPALARRLIEEEYGIQVFGGFGAVEAPSIGFECEHHAGYHISVDLCAVRVADAEGQTLPDGNSGHLVISNLLNRGTVLLNYRLGDMGVLQKEVCRCGRTLPRVVELQGRSEDFIQLPPGKRAHPYLVYKIFRREPQVWEWQLVQQSPERITVSIVPSETCDRQEVARRITHSLRHVLGDALTVEVCFVSAVPRTTAGKVRAVISLSGRQELQCSAAPTADCQLATEERAS